VADIKESERRSTSQLKLIASIVMLSICISIVTSTVVVKTLVPTLPMFTSTPIYLVASNTLMPSAVNHTLPSATLYALPSVTLSPTPRKMPEVETNLLQNSGFENGLSGWRYSNNLARLNVYETVGVNGKGFCSRQYLPHINLDHTMADYVNEEWAGFVQEVSVEPNQTYFFSGWVKLDKAINVYALAQYYNGSEYLGWGLATHPIGVLPDGATTTGWFFIYGDVPIYLPGTDHVLIGLWHGVINSPPNNVDSTICADDLFFGRIIE
jgi:hypothetical protein